jgi:hypothetical protein
MSVDVGLIARKTKTNWSFYEICLSVPESEHLLIKVMGDLTEKQLTRYIKFLNKDLLEICWAEYEAIFIEHNKKEHKKTLQNIKAIKAETASAMKSLIKKHAKHNR